MTDKIILSELKKIAKKYEGVPFKCVSCFDEMETFLKKYGIYRYQKRTISSQYMFIGLKKNKNTCVSDNGYHVALSFSGKIFDNFFQGLPEKKWEKSFIGEKLFFS